MECTQNSENPGYAYAEFIASKEMR